MVKKLSACCSGQKKFVGLSLYQAIVVVLATAFSIMFIPASFVVANLPINVVVGLAVWSVLLGFCYHFNARSELKVKKDQTVTG